MIQFTKATKIKSKARIALTGPSGSGKTFSALAIASGLGRKIAVIDTEHGSASKYSKEFDFDVVELRPASPDNYIKAIKAAKDYDVLIVDSFSHAWAGSEGILEMVDKIASTSQSKNTYFAWGKGTEKQNELVDALLEYPGHLITTLRVKTAYEVQDKGGKKVPVKVGLAPIQRENISYEFDLVGELDLEHNMHVSKSRCAQLDQKVFDKPDNKFAQELLDWLNDGAEAPVKPRKDVAVAKEMFDGPGAREVGVPEDKAATVEEMTTLLKHAIAKGWTKQDLNDYFVQELDLKPGTKVMNSQWAKAAVFVEQNPKEVSNG
ncbi:MAG TPA: ATP-binding protein [Candidatus Saccharimonadales bacterium]